MNSLTVIIPTINKNKPALRLLQEDIRGQKIDAKVSVEIVEGVCPAGKARNLGARKSSAEVLVFLDDDIRLGDENVFKNLRDSLLSDAKIGISSAAVRLPKIASEFQKNYAQQIPHCQVEVVAKIMDIWVATSACCAIKNEIFIKTNGFNEVLPRGQDPEFSRRLRELGYRTVLAPQTFFYHPVPGNLKDLIQIELRNGQATAFVDRYYPELNVDLNPQGIECPAGKQNLQSRAMRFVITFINGIFHGRFLLAVSKLAYSLGYLSGRLKSKRSGS